MTINPLEVFSDRVRRFGRETAHAARMRYRYRRPFSGSAEKRLLLLTIDQRIPQSQIYPFHHYAGQIRARHGVEIREVTAEDYLAARHPGLDGATTVAFQSDFNISRDAFGRLLDVVRARSPEARIAYIDWFAPTDLRLAEMFDPHVSVYVKKHVLSDLDQYGKPTIGDTNLSDYYSRKFGIDAPETVFPIPDGFFDKLLVGPSFATASLMLKTFLLDAPPGTGDRPIDVHARIAVKGTGWYQAMRTECLAVVQRLDDLHTEVETGVGLVRYLHELRASKIVFSPFGYGEVCWRDYEAIANGAVLLKPDMSHIRTDPDIFIPGETYMPVRRDLADFEEKVRLLLADAELRSRLTRQAFAVLRDYTREARFVDQMAPMFA